MAAAVLPAELEGIVTDSGFLDHEGSWQSFCQEVLRRVEEHGLVHFRKPISRDAYDALADRLGAILDRQDIVIDGRLGKANRKKRKFEGDRPGPYDPAGLDFHTDRPTADILGFFCAHPGDEDGPMLLKDTSGIEEELSDEALDALAKLPVRYMTSIASYEHPLLWRTRDRPRIYYVPWLLPSSTTPRQARALRELEELLAGRPSMQVRPRAGECVFIDNHRLLHARGPLPDDSERHLHRVYLQLPESASAENAPLETEPALARFTPRPMERNLARKLEREISWVEYVAASSPFEAGAVAEILERPIIHIGSRAHERWSVQSEVLAVTDLELSALEAAAVGMVGRKVMCWSYNYWTSIPAEKRRDNRVVCFFHHRDLHGIEDPQVVAGICMNREVEEELRRRAPEKPVLLAHVGGSEAALPHARRVHPTPRIRLFMTGSMGLPERYDTTEEACGRKGGELVPRIAARLDADRYAWVFVGPGWSRYAEPLAAAGWTVLAPGGLAEPDHLVYFGEGDVYLMLAREEGGPLAMLETMGLGMWPVCTATGMVPEVLPPGEFGHLLPRYDGANGDEVVDRVVRHLQTLTVEALEAAKPRIRQSVENRTWEQFRQEVEPFIERVLLRGSNAGAGFDR